MTFEYVGAHKLRLRERVENAVSKPDAFYDLDHIHVESCGYREALRQIVMFV